MASLIGSKIPSVNLWHMSEGKPVSTSTEKIFANCTVVLFSVPGAFTPTCSQEHLPGFEKHAGEFLKKGVDKILCLATNDPFVMQAWKKHEKITNVEMLSDPKAEFATKLGQDFSADVVGVRMKRTAMVVKNGIIELFEVDEKGMDKTRAESMLRKLGEYQSEQKQ